MDGSPFDDRATMYDGSQVTLRSSLDLFSLPKTDISCAYSTQHMPVFPVLSVKDGENPLEFIVNTETSYVDLSETYLKVAFRVTKDDGKPCATSDEVAPANLMFGLMFKNMEVYLNNKLVSDTSNNYPYVHYIQRLLTMPESLKNSILKGEFYYPDATPDAFDLSTTPKPPGFEKRFEASKVSQPVVLLGQLVGGLFQQQRWLGPGNELKIVLRRSHPKFCLDSKVTTTNYKVDVKSAVLLVQKKPVTQKVTEIHRSLLEKNETMKYILNEPVVKTATIPSGVSSYTTEGIIVGRVPKVLCIGLVSNEAYNGNLTKSPMNFAHNNLSEVTVTWNNAESIESRTIPLNFKTDTNTAPDDVLEGVLSLQKAVANDLMWNGISKDNYANGNALVCVELLPNYPEALSVIRNGQVKLSLQFRSGTTEPLTLVLFGLYQNILEIDRNRNVIIDRS